MSDDSHLITNLLRQLPTNDDRVLIGLYNLVEKELQRRAHDARTRDRFGWVNVTGELVNQAFLALIDAQKIEWKDRTHFYTFAARVYRQRLTDWARAERAVKRGGGKKVAGLDDVPEPAATTRDPDLELAIDGVLERLAEESPDAFNVFHYRWYLGLSVEETAKELSLTEDEVRKLFREAKSILRSYLE